MKKFAVIGTGSFGYHVAKALYENRNEVIAIDRDKVRVQAIEPYCTSAIVQDVTDFEALKSLGLQCLEVRHILHNGAGAIRLYGLNPHLVRM